jgi:flavin reductase (DIM6/NTAB) family NADH-FMN oxidoreductase RutF
MFHGSLSPIAPKDVRAEVDVESFRQAMRELAGGVAIVTVGKDDALTGFTATSVSSLSAQPPRLIVCVDRGSASWLSLQRHPYFGVNILRNEEYALASRFAGKDGVEGSARYAGTQWTTLATGALILKNGLASLDCEVEELLMRYDHSIVIGRVRAVQVCPGAVPLVYWKGNYHAFAPAVGSTDR